MEETYDVDELGPRTVRSPIELGTERGDLLADFTPDETRVVADISMGAIRAAFAAGREPDSLEVAGPRQHIFFEPSKLQVGIMTAGGLCPGLNDVIRGLVMTLHHGYGVRRIFGFRYGYAGLVPEPAHPPIVLSPTGVRDIHRAGGTILGTSRGPQPIEAMVDSLERMGVGLLFAIGGDGTFRGALAIHDEVKRRGLEIGVVGIPKTIDNDIPMVDRTFGFLTAVSAASEAIQAAYVEASSAALGVGLVKLMGRHSGFIAASAALANRNVNLVLVPELPFDLEGDQGLFAYLERRFVQEKSTVIVVAEGAGQDLFEDDTGTDKSGNRKLGDVGALLKRLLAERFGRSRDLTLKYIDPSYMIRSLPARPNDAIFCGYLAQAAAHAGMAGKTGMAVGRSHGELTHIPLRMLVRGRKRIDPEGQLWLSVLESTGQPYGLSPLAAER